MSRPTLQIGDLAVHTGASPRSLRHYEQQGLLSPGRGDNGYRVYDETDIVRAGNIKDLLEAGLTTADIRKYVERGCLDRPLDTAPRCPAELETATRRLAGMDELIERLQKTRSRLADHAGALEESLHTR